MKKQTENVSGRGLVSSSLAASPPHPWLQPPAPPCGSGQGQKPPGGTSPPCPGILGLLTGGTPKPCLASLLAQLVKNPPVMQETWLQSLRWEDPLGKEKATHSSILAWNLWGRRESDTTEQVSLTHSLCSALCSVTMCIVTYAHGLLSASPMDVKICISSAQNSTWHSLHFCAEKNDQIEVTLLRCGEGKASGIIP